MPKLFIDFETRSACDLKAEGLYRYASHPTTQIMCMAYAFEDEEPELWVEGDPFPAAVIEHIRLGQTVVAHNAQFERLLWKNRIHVAPVAVWQWNCTMVRAYAMGLPGGLEKAAAAVGLSQQKDTSGHRLMMKLSQPRSITSDGKIIWWNDPADLERLYEYCRQDLRVTQELDKRVLNLTPDEHKLWCLDQEINDRGMYVDLPAVKTAETMVATDQLRLNAELRKITHDQVATYNARNQFVEYLRNKGIETPGVAKNDVSNLLSRPDLPSDVRSALEIRREGAKSSTAKLKAFSARTCADQRIRGFLQFYGAGTGRWAGRGVQLHNLPRQKYSPQEIETLFDCLREGPIIGGDEIRFLFGSISSALSEALRGFLTSAPNRKLIAADFSAIEARVLAWLAGQESVLEVFRTHGKLYEQTAAEIYGVPIDKVTKEQRQIGKVAALALGYQGGVNAFQQMAVGYGVRINSKVSRDLWDRSPQERKKKATWGWEQRGRKSGVEKDEWIGCELIKLAWREANEQIVAYWARVEEAAVDAVNSPGLMTHAHYVQWKQRGSFLFCHLPSGRCLSYAYPELVEEKTEWGQTRTMLKYKAEDSQTKEWKRFTAYGGLLVENITQAVARDVLADAMVTLNDAGWRIVLHVHDEVVAETSDGKMEEFVRIVSQVPSWADGLPIEASAWEGQRYRK